jgi:hypothetical protein
MVRNYPPAWVCRMLLPMGDEKLCQRDLVTTIPLCPSLQLDSILPDVVFFDKRYGCPSLPSGFWGH